jgi:hypothetical protein
MAYRDDRVAMLARADALEQALDEADTKRAHAEAERDALASEAALLRAALVRAIGSRGRPLRVVHVRPPVTARLLALAALVIGGFAMAAVTSARSQWKEPTSARPPPVGMEGAWLLRGELAPALDDGRPAWPLACSLRDLPSRAR